VALAGAGFDFVACEDYPPVVFGGPVDELFCLFTIHAVYVKGSGLRQVAKGRVVRCFGPVAASDDESFGDEGDIAFGVWASADEGLAARVGVCYRSYAKQVFDLDVCVIQLLSHFFECIFFKRLVACESEIARAGVQDRVISYFMSVCNRPAPVRELRYYIFRRYVESGLDAVFVENGYAIFGLAGARVVECQADRRTFAFGPAEIFLLRQSCVVGFYPLPTGLGTARHSRSSDAQEQGSQNSAVIHLLDLTPIFVQYSAWQGIMHVKNQFVYSGIWFDGRRWFWLVY
jgi:hypothetical protein